MACSTTDAFDIVCRLDRDGKLDEVLALTEFHMAPKGVLGDWAPSSFLMLIDFCWEEESFQNISLKVGRFLSPRLLTLMTMEEVFDLQTHFAL